MSMSNDVQSKGALRIIRESAGTIGRPHWTVFRRRPLAIIKVKTYDRQRVDDIVSSNITINARPVQSCVPHRARLYDSHRVLA